MKFEELLVLKNKQRPEWKAPKRLLAIDPGETTGWAVFESTDISTKPVQLYSCGHWPSKASLPQEAIALLDHTEPTEIICEDYKVYLHKLQDHAWNSLFTPQLIGALRVLAWQRNIPMYFHMASAAKGFCTDDKLKEWGFYSQAKRHSRDAIRHACYHLLFDTKLTNRKD